MNISCTICTEYLVPESESFSTQCGHIFHHACLIQWIERSKTCPQCRCKTTEKSIHKVFLHDSNATITETAGSLLNKLSSLEIHCKKIKEKNELFKNRNGLLRNEIKNLEDKCSLNDSTISALREQMIYYKNKCKNQDKLEQEILRLKEKIQTMEDVETVITGSSEQVRDMLKHNRDPQSLHVLIVTLKNELMQLDRQKKVAIQRMKESQMEATNYQRNLKESQLENSNFKQQLETLKHSETERLYLKRQFKKLKEVQNKCESAQSMERVLLESPAPLRAMKRKSELDSSLIDLSETPPIQVKVKSIVESESPYLPIKSSNIFCRISDTNPELGKTATSDHFSKMSIFNKNRQNRLELKPCTSNEGVSFDGLGGHSKEDLYPTPIKLFKKNKSSSTISSSKFKKLAPHNQKLSSFFSVTSPGSSGSNNSSN